MGAPATTFKVTVDGGIPVFRGNLASTALAIVGDHHGRRYVRRMDDLQQVLTVDVDLARITVHRGGRVLDNQAFWPEWVRQLLAMLRAAIPQLTQGATPDGNTSTLEADEQEAAGRGPRPAD